MTYQEFYSKYINQKLDYDNVWRFQCVDLAKAVGDWIWGLKSGSVGYSGGAKDIMRNNSIWENTYVNRVPNTPNGVPPKGAVIVFDSTLVNKFGHVGIVDSADKDWIYVLEQNGGRGSKTGTGSDAIRVTKYGYTDFQQKFRLFKFGVGKCLGWVVPKNGKLA